MGKPENKRPLGGREVIIIIIIIIIMIYFKKIENYKKFLAYRFIYIKIGLKEPGGSLPPLRKPAIGPYLQQELSNLPDHNPPPSYAF